MREGYEAYKKYLAIKLHFTKDEFDFFKYGETKAKYETFVQRNDRYFFVKAARKYGDELTDYFVSNFVSNKTDYIKDFNEDSYYNWRKKIDGLTYYFKLDIEKLLKKTDNNFDKIFKCYRGQHPPLLKMYMAKKITLETMCILETLVNYTKVLDKKIDETYVWPTVKRKIIKYKPFIKFNKERMKLELRKML
tara:strand:- start:6028 stop:6603 length:576 start_codon:yes stop_codon:yes gene_type:complete